MRSLASGFFVTLVLDDLWSGNDSPDGDHVALAGVGILSLDYFEPSTLVCYFVPVHMISPVTLEKWSCFVPFLT